MGNISLKSDTNALPSVATTVENASNLDSLTKYFEGMGDIKFSLIQDLLVDILSFVPGDDLMKYCRCVCKEWKDLVDGHSVWKLKCLRENRNVPSAILEIMPDHYYRNIYFLDPYGRNLVENPCGEEQLAKWTVPNYRGENGFVIENPPAGADSVPKEVGSQSCFATTYFECVKYQLINLHDVGIHKEILQLEKTKIEIGEWYAARFDCSSEYKVTVLLFDETFNPEGMVSDQDNSIVDCFEYSFREEQWVGKEWHCVNHVFENVGRVKYVFFQHYGKDCQFWAGSYGSKMTGAYVKVIA